MAPPQRYLQRTEGGWEAVLRGRLSPGQVMSSFFSQMGVIDEESKAFKDFAKRQLSEINEKCQGAEYRTINELGSNELHWLLKKMRGLS